MDTNIIANKRQVFVSHMTQKRILGELRLLKEEPLELIDAYLDENNTLQWYFVIRGMDETDYYGGFFIGVILIPPEYPQKAPDFMMLTPNGRFATNKKICLTNSGYHSESWSPIWNIRLQLLGFISIMADDSTNGISHIKESPESRKQKAKQSVDYNMQYLKDKWVKFERFVKPDGTIRSEEEIKLLSVPIKKKKKKKKKKATK